MTLTLLLALTWTCRGWPWLWSETPAMCCSRLCTGPWPRRSTCPNIGDRESVTRVLIRHDMKCRWRQRTRGSYRFGVVVVEEANVRVVRERFGPAVLGAVALDLPHVWKQNKTKKSNICTDFGCKDTLTVFIRDRMKGCRHHHRRRDPWSRGRAPDRWRPRPGPRWPPASSSGCPTSTGTLRKQEARQGQRLSSWRRHRCHEVNEILPTII